MTDSNAENTTPKSNQFEPPYPKIGDPDYVTYDPSKPDTWRPYNAPLLSDSDLNW